MTRLSDRQSTDRSERMSEKTNAGRFWFFCMSVTLALMLIGLPDKARAHCDTMDGPVVTDARAALEAGDVVPVLKWIPVEDETRIKAAFENTLAVREVDARVRELADRYFFETLVRLHRASEGAPFTGIQPAGTPVEPVIAEADRALAARSISHLAQHLNEALRDQITHRFERVLSSSDVKDSSVAQGREFVEAYVEFTHFVERLHQSLSTLAAHHSAHPAH